MKNIKEILIASLFCIISNGYIKCQTIEWDEYFTTTVFYDDFSNSPIDLNKWSVEDDDYLYHTAFIDSSATVSIDGGNLRLTSIWCSNCSSGGYTEINAAAGKVTSKDKFQYGIFESRIFFPRKEGTSAFFELRGGNDMSCEQGGLYENEIDIANSWWRYFYPHYHFTNLIRHYHTGTDCVEDYQNVDFLNYVNSWDNTYHIYKCIWTPSYVRYYINDSLRREVLNTGSLCPECNQEWFPEFPMNLSFYQILNTDVLLYMEIPQTTYIDYVSVKKFFATPEITVPSLICTTGSALMDVDNNASNITWSLTPSSLFSGTTSGLGKTASITAATGASGQAKITYTFKMPSVISGEIFTAEKTFWVGKPGTPLTTPSGYPTLELGLGAYQPISLFKTPGFTGGNINWWSTGSISPSGSTTGTTCTFEAVSLGTGNFYVTVQNTCGTSPTGGGTVNVVLGGGGQMMLILSPNPTTGETILSIEPTTEKTTFDETTEWDLEIYDQAQYLKEKNTKIKGKEHKIQTAGWKEGVYAVRVKYKDEILLGKLVVKK